MLKEKLLKKYFLQFLFSPKIIIFIFIFFFGGGVKGRRKDGIKSTIIFLKSYRGVKSIHFVKTNISERFSLFDQINMAVLFWYHRKSGLSSVGYWTQKFTFYKVPEKHIHV